MSPTEGAMGLGLWGERGKGDKGADWSQGPNSALKVVVEVKIVTFIHRRLPRTRMPEDLILRERVQFTLDAQGDQTTVYGRIDLDDFVSITKREGILIKECYIMPKYQAAGAQGLSNTGVFNPMNIEVPSLGGLAITHWGGMKIYLTTTAYENAIDVGIASPNVLHLETWANWLGENAATATAGRGLAVWNSHQRYSLQDLHQGEYPVITDVLVGLAVDNFDVLDLEVFEVDVVMIAETVKVTPTQLTTMLTQAQDL